MTEDIILILQFMLAPIVATTIAAFTIHYAKKSHKRIAMMDVFHMINNDLQKTTEDKIIKLFKEEKLDEGLKNQEFYEYVKKVWRNYDQIGSLIKNGLIPKKEFYNLFGIKMTALYFCLLLEIERRRKTKPFSLLYFTNMAIDFFEYWTKKGNEIKNPRTNSPLKQSDLGEKIKIK